MIKNKVYKNLAIALSLLFVLETPISTLATTDNTKITVTKSSSPKTKLFTEIKGKRVEGFVNPKDFNSEVSKNATVKNQSNSINPSADKESKLNTNFKKGEKKASTEKVDKTNVATPTPFINEKVNIKTQATSSSAKSIKPVTEQEAAKDELIIKYKSGTSILTKNNLYTKNNLKIKKQSNTSKLDLVKIPQGANLDSFIEKIKFDPSVEYVQKNYKYTTDAITNDPMADKLWGINNTSQAINGKTGVNDIDIDAPEAWAVTKGSPNVVVGVIDTGIDINHPDIKNNIWVNTNEIPNNNVDDDDNGYVDDVNGWDFYNDDNTVFNPEDGDDHGTHVTGTIAASINNSTGVVGVAPSTKIMPLKFIGSDGGYTFDAIRALDYAKAKGVKITNNSWGGGGYDAALEEAIKNFGGLFVAAAGNESNDNDSFQTYPGSYNLDNILSVAAIDNTGAIANFSNFGKTTVDVAAPGVDILSSVPKEPALGAVIGSTLNGKNSVTQGFSNHIFNNDTDKKAFLTNTLNYMTVAKSEAVLVVKDDDSTPDVSSSYDPLIKALGYTNVTSWNTLTQGVPSVEELTKYSAVIWYTGEVIGFYADAVYNLTDYVNAGGKLNLSGSYVTAVLDGSPLLDALGTDMLYYDFSRSNATQLNGVIATTFAGMNLNFAPNNFVAYLSGASYDSVPAIVSYSPVATTLVKFNSETDYSKCYDYYNGTSMATPHVTGVAALLASKNITDPLSIKSLIMNSVTPIQGLDGLMVKPGIVNAEKALTMNPDDEIPGIALKNTQTETLNSSTDIDDVYYVDVKAGDNITVNLTGATGTDFDLHLYSADAKTVKSAEGIVASSEGVTSTESITYTATQSGKYYVDVYAYSGSGSYTLNYVNSGSVTNLTIEDNSKDLLFSGAWATLSNATNYSGGTVKQLNSKGHISYTGTMETVKWTGFKGPNQGIANVYIDGVLYGKVDLYASTYSYKQVLFETVVSHGTHTVKVEWTGTANAAVKKGSANINIDTIYTTTNKTKPYGVSNLTVENPFIEELDLYFDYKNDDSIDYFNIYRSVDGKNYSIIDTIAYFGPYSYYYEDKNFDSNYTTYYYKITAVNLDGVESPASNIASSKVKFANSKYNLDNASPYVGYTGTWTKEVDPSYDNGSRHITLNAGDKVTVPFSGFNGNIATYYGSDMGIVKITLPFGVSYTVDLYDPFDSGVANLGFASSAKMNSPVIIECISGKAAFDSLGVIDSTSAAPSNPTGLIGTLTSGKPVLKWALNPEADTAGYNIYRSSTAGSGYTKLNADLVKDLTYTDAAALTGNNYYVVKAVNYAGLESGASNEVCVLPQSEATTPGLYEENSSFVTFTGNWINHSSPSVSGGKGKYSINTGDYVEFKFSGTSIKWISYLTKDRGIAEVYIDGILDKTVDTSSSTAKYKEIIYEKIGLTNTTHTIRIKVTGNKSSTSTSPMIYIDAFDFSVEAVTPGRYEENSSFVGFTGNWINHSNSSVSGGKGKYSINTGDYVEFKFSGTSIKWISYLTKDRGIAEVYIDGILDKTVDTSSSTSKYKEIVYEKIGLTNTTHTIRIKVTGNKSSTSTSPMIYIDAFDFSVEAVTPGRYEENSSFVGFSGSWINHSNSYLSGGKGKYSINTGDYVEFKFSGTSIKWISYLTKDRGIAEVYIDGILDKTVDTSSSTSKYKETVYEKTNLANTTHTIKIKVTGNKSSASTSPMIYIDAFDFN